MEEYVFNKYKEQVYNLKNGLTIHYFPYPEYHTSYFGFIIPYGSNMSDFTIDGKRVKTGIAHFLEHRMFDSKSGDLSMKFAEIGAFCNAFTCFDRTVYYAQSSFNQFDSFKILCDLVFSFYSSKQKIINERSIIMEEQLEGISSPRDEMNQYLTTKIFTTCCLKYPIIGNKKDIMSTTLKDLEDAYEAFYNPSEMILVVVGPDPIEPIINYLNNYRYRTPKKVHEIKRINKLDTYGDTEVKTYKLKRNVSTKINYIKIKADISPLINEYGREKLDKILSFAWSLLFDNGSLFLEEFYKLNVTFNSLDFGFLDCDGNSILRINYLSSSSIKQSKMIFDALKNPLKYITQRNLDLYEKRFIGKNLSYFQSIGTVFQDISLILTKDTSYLSSFINNEKILLRDIEHVIKYFSDKDYIKGIIIPKK